MLFCYGLFGIAHKERKTQITRVGVGFGNILLVNANKAALLARIGKDGKDITAVQCLCRVGSGINLIGERCRSIGALQGKYAVVTVNAYANLLTAQGEYLGNADGKFLINKITLTCALQILGGNACGHLHAIGGGVGGNYGRRNGCILRQSVV